MKDCEKWFKQPIIKAVNKKFPSANIVEVFNKEKYMSGIYGAPCTRELKKGARYEFEKNNAIDYHVLGFTFDEKHRSQRFIKYERSNLIPILINLKLTKGNCFDILIKEKIKITKIYKLGFPNANCIGCVKIKSDLLEFS